MQVSGVKIFEPISALPQSKLILNPGQVISAQIVKAEGSQILLQFGSYLFKAKTELPLKPGEQIQLVVESIDNNKINLKIISGTEDKTSSTITATLSPLQSHDPHWEMIARQLTRFHLPVSLELLNDIYKLIKKNNLAPEISQLLVWLKSAGITVDSQQDLKALLWLHKFFQGELKRAEEAPGFALLNAAENQVTGGLNIYGWPLGSHHIYFVQAAPKNQALVADNCQLALRINSQALQELWFLIDISSHIMTFSIYCQDEESKKILDNEVVTFQAALEAAGYQIKNVKIMVNKGNPILFDILPVKEFNRIDINI